MPNKGYDPSSKNELPGGRYKPTSFYQDVYDISHDEPPGPENIGSRAGTATRREGVVGKIGRAIGDTDTGLRAYTPQEAQKAQAGVDAESMRQQAQEAPGGMKSYKTGGVVDKTGPALLHKGERVIPATRGLTGKGKNMKSQSSAPKGMTLHSITTKKLKDGTYHHEHRFNDKDGNPHHVTHEYSSATNRDAGDHVAEQFEQPPMPDGQANAPETVPTGEQPSMPPEMAGM